MPYFHRKPTGALIDIARSRAQIPGLPSRGPATYTRVAARTQPVSLPAAITGVEQGAAVLTSKRLPSTAKSSAAPALIVEPAPVLSPPGPIAPGGSAQFAISLVNDDERPAQVAFFSTDLIGEDGAHLPAEGVSFRPRELTLLSGQAGDVIVRVVVPAHTRCGVYSGLIRASTLEYLHAVLVVQVEEP
jgi:hypothetical protein